MAMPRERSWQFDVWILTFVTLGIIWDWVPETYFNLDPGTFSLNRLIVQPLIAVDLVVNVKRYVDLRRMWPAWLWLVSLLWGIGSGVLFGTVQASRLTSVLPTATIFLFYVCHSEPAEVRRALQVMFYSAFFVPITICLGYLGFVANTTFILDNKLRVVRTIAGPNWSSVSQFLAVPVAFIGGASVLAARGGSLRTGVLVGAGSLLAVAASVITAQRASMVVLTFVGGFCVVRAMLTSKRAASASLVALVTVAGGVYLLSDSSTEQTEVVQQRWAPQALERTGREGTLDFTIDHFLSHFALVPPGMIVVENQFVVGTHFILGEAYFDGGVLVLFSLLLITARGSVKAWRGWRLSSNDSSGILLTLILGWAVALCLHPGLQTRILYVGLGLANSPWVVGAVASRKSASAAEQTQPLQLVRPDDGQLLARTK